MKKIASIDVHNPFICVECVCVCMLFSFSEFFTISIFTIIWTNSQLNTFFYIESSKIFTLKVFFTDQCFIVLFLSLALPFSRLLTLSRPLSYSIDVFVVIIVVLFNYNCNSLCSVAVFQFVWVLSESLITGSIGFVKLQ